MKLNDSQSEKVQILRGLAIIAVVLIHNTPGGVCQVYCRPFINFSVGLFLFLSGLLSTREKWKPQKRFSKVMIPYFIWTLIYIIMTNDEGLFALPINYVKGILAANSAPMMYYILVYCQFTLLIPLIDKLGKSKFKWTGFFISPIEIILMRVLPMITKTTFSYSVRTIMDISCLCWFVYFYLV